MSGKAYTMKEMKAIVDYLTERKAYGEIRGRKMWMDFEKSKFTDRTWQSLKETFLKRILPDIHNPYYHLSMTQISSFKQGYDVEAKLKNKLEIRSVSEESSNANKSLNAEQPCTSSNKDDEKKSGEESINSKNVSHHRSSAETIILDPCYETAEDIQRDLESPKQGQQTERENESDKSSAKSIRDFITYSEPLTPMLQEVIEDFATDEECEPSDTERQSTAAKDIDANTHLNGANGHTSDVLISSETDEISNNADKVNKSVNVEKNQLDEASNKNETAPVEKQSAQNKLETIADKVIEIEDTENLEKDKNNKLHISEQTETHDCDKTEQQFSEKNPHSNNDSDSIANNVLDVNEKDVTDNEQVKDTISQTICTENNSNTTIDTLLPNNQEELNIRSDAVPFDNSKKNKNKEFKPKILTLNKNSERTSRKRAISQEPTITKHKKRNLIESSKQISVSDTDAGVNRKVQLKAVSKTVLTSNRQKEHILPISNNENKEDNTMKQKMSDEIEKVNEASAELTRNKDNEQTLHSNANDIISSDIENPCLKSVSLYDEQYTSMKYSESSDEVPSTSNKDAHVKTKDHKNTDSDRNEIVLLKSHSESDNNKMKKKSKDTSVRHVLPRSERDKALANVFGFSSGAVTSSRKRRVSYQNRSTRQRSHTKISSGSSEWTSETDTEFISPPRGRRNRPGRKYLKPKSARILSLEEEGGLFVMYGKKIYPVVKDGRIVKNYVTYAPEHDSEDEEESYWKLKYIEEKKRTAKLTKLLHQNTDDDLQSSERGVSSDFIKPNPPKKPKSIKNQIEISEKLSGQEEAKKPVDIQQPAPTADKTLKIKITKQNEEVQLEGHWSQIHPVLDHVVQIFHKEIEPRMDVRTTPQPELRKNSSSGISTPVVAVPVDQEVHEKVNKLETEIFKEIEARDNQEKGIVEPQPVQESKIFKRRGRPKKSLPPTVSNLTTPEKKQKIALESPTLQIEENVEKLPIEENLKKMPIEENVTQLAPIETENGTNISFRRKTRTPKKVLHESTERNESNVVNTRTKKIKDTQATTEELVDDETDVRYKFPSPPPSGKKTYRKSGANKTPKEQKPKNRYTKKMVGIFSSPNNISINSVESSQGYQDSDISPYIDVYLRKKKKIGVTSLYNREKYHTRKSIRRRTQFNVQNVSDQSSNSCAELTSKSMAFQNSSLNTEIYRSDSYQLLVPKVRNSFNQLAKIDEVNQDDKANFEMITQTRESNKSEYFNNTVNDASKKDFGSYGDTTDIVNSSNMSLPPSPVLSIVENISVNQNTLSSVDEEIIEENNGETEDHEKECNYSKDFKITELDVSMPLMQQICGLQTSSQYMSIQKYNQNNAHFSEAITDSFLNKICTVNIDDNPTLSDTINQKLRNLLLESAKKQAQASQVQVIEENYKMDVDTNTLQSKTRLKKRSSTPRKRQSTRTSKSRKPAIETFIEEEHIESCSHGGRKSCPPLITISSPNKYTNYNENITTGTKSNITKRRKKKENIIKVKILRPKSRNNNKETDLEELIKHTSEKSLYADSGINDTESGVFLRGFNDSVDLIHNHSDTCLQANECLGDSIEFIENSTKSVISVDSNSGHSIDIECNNQFDNNMSCQLLTNNAHEAINFPKVNNIIRPKDTESNEGTYHTPMNSEGSPTSLMTEDLSNDLPVLVHSTTRSSNWYFFSEDETTNTNFANQKNSNSNINYGSNLNQLFPIACAVPDLSTITEISRDIDTKSIVMDGDTNNEFQSQSIFDCNFDNNI